VRDLASRRMHEAREATALLGVPRSQQLFLGYPDGGILQLLTDNRTTPYRAKFTGDTRVPYANVAFPGHPYTGTSLEHDFASILDRVRPTLVLAPSLDDAHPDHSATGKLVTRLLLRRGEASKLHYWIVHGGEGWPSPRGYMPGIPLETPATAADLRLQPFTLTDGEEARELQAVNAYHTQMEVMAPFLLAFVRTSELFSGPPPTIQHPVQHSRDTLLHPADPGALRPVSTAEHFRLQAISFEHAGGKRCESGVLDLLVGLEVPFETPPIEVARA